LIIEPLALTDAVNEFILDVNVFIIEPLAFTLAVKVLSEEVDVSITINLLLFTSILLLTDALYCVAFPKPFIEDALISFVALTEPVTLITSVPVVPNDVEPDVDDMDEDIA